MEVDHAMFGPYRLVGVLGHGPGATVHRALDTGHDDRVVALKIFEPSPDPGFAARLHHDAAVLAALREPHVPPIHRYGEIDGRCYVDMRLVPGRSLTDALRRGSLDPAREHAIGAQLHAAAGALHAAGLGHRFDRDDVLLVGDPGPGEFVQVVGIPLGRMPGHGPPVALADLLRAPRRRRRRLLITTGVLATVAVLGAAALVAVRYAGSDAITADVSGLVTTITSAGGQVVDADTVEIDGRPVLAGVAGDGSVHTWDIGTGSERRPPIPGAAAALRIATIDGRPVMITRNRDTTVELHDLDTGAPLGAPIGTPAPPEVAKPGQVLVGFSGGLETTRLAGSPVLIRLVATGAVLTSPSGYHHDPQLGVQAFSLPAVQPLGPVVSEPGGSIYTASPVPFDDRTAVVTTAGNRVHAYDLLTGKPIGTPGAVQPVGIYQVASTVRDGTPLAVTGGADNLVRIWDLRSGAQVGAPLSGLAGAVGHVYTVPVGDRTVVVASTDTTMTSGSTPAQTGFWDLATGAPLGTPLVGHPLARLLTVDRDRSLLVAAARDGTVTVWDAATLTRGASR